MGEMTTTGQADSVVHQTAGWDTPTPRPRHTSGRAVSAPSSDLLVALARRLQERADRQSAVLDRLRTVERSAHVLSELAALDDAVRRTRRDAENLLVVAGAAPTPPTRPAAPFADLVHEAAGAVELSARVSIAPVPTATVPSWAVADLVHVLTEILDHAAQIAPMGGRIDVITRESGTGGMVVEAIVDGPGLPIDQLDTLNRLLAGESTSIPPQHLGLLAAAEIARRAGIEVRFQHRLDGPDLTGPGLISTVRCPPNMIQAQRQPAEPPRGAPPRQRDTETPRHSRTRSVSSESEWSPDAPEPDAEATTDSWAAPEAPAESPPSPPSRSAADELFGPLVSIDDHEDLSATPIFEAVASAWFRERKRSEDAEDWETPSDAEWRAAAERANRAESNLGTTASGLPRRRPGSQMVAPPRHGAGPAPTPQPVARAPERVRHQLSAYQRGLQHGRHRAADPDNERDRDGMSWWTDIGG